MVVETRVIMYGFWASSCSWRVRAALHMKRIPYEERRVDIVKQMAQRTEEFRAINPSQKVPAVLIDLLKMSKGVVRGMSKSLLYDGVTLVESMAIIQYLEDTRPQPSLMPKSPLLRARAREISETIVSGIQPLQNIGLKSHFEKEEQFLEFAKHFTKRGLQSLESFLEKSAGQYCVGDDMTLADLCLVPQLYNCFTRYDSDYEWFKAQKTEETPTTWRQMVAEEYPTVSKVYDNLLKHDVFIETHPTKIKSKIVQ